MKEDIMGLINNTNTFLKSEIDYRKILFEEWEMTPLQESYFTNLCHKKPDFAAAINRDATDDFKKYIEYQIRRGANINLIVAGEQGCGKSTFAMAVFLYYQRIHLLRYGHRVLAPFISFSLAETNTLYNEVGHHQFIFQDEEDELEGEGSRTTHKRLGNLVKRARFTGISLVKCSPELTTIKGCDYAILPMGFYREGAERFRRTGDESDCWARAMLFVKSKLFRDKYDPQGFVYFYTGSAMKYMNLIGYEDRKEKSWEDRKSKMGGSGADKRKIRQKNEEYAKILYDKAIERGWDGNAKTELDTALLYCDEISVSANQLKHLKNEVCRMYQEKKEQNDEDLIKKQNKLNKVQVSEDISDFDPDVDSIYTQIRRSSKSDLIERDIEIHKAIKDPLVSGDDLALKWGVSKTRIRQIKKKITGKVSQILGKRFEDFYEQFLEREFRSVKMDGGVGKPDAECLDEDGTVWFISIKCYEFWRKSFPISYEEAHPEIRQAQKVNMQGGNARVRQDVFNIYNKKLYRHEIEPEILTKEVPMVEYKKKNMLIRLSDEKPE